MEGIYSNYLIISLLVFIIIIVLGINVKYYFNNVGNYVIGLGSFFTNIIDYFMDVLKLLGFSTGSALNATADVIGDASVTGINIVEDSVKSFGNLLKNTPPPPSDVQPVKENLENINFDPSPFSKTNHSYTMI